jgi:pimeloyl-ACP methyl ester carboxylesterase
VSTSSERSTPGAILQHRAQESPDKVAYTYLGDGQNEAARLSYQVTGTCAPSLHLRNLVQASGRAPLLYLWGSASPTTPLSDVQQLQSAYGGPAQIAILDGGGHTLILEPSRDDFWDRAAAFLE